MDGAAFTELLFPRGALQTCGILDACSACQTLKHSESRIADFSDSRATLFTSFLSGASELTFLTRPCLASNEEEVIAPCADLPIPVLIDCIARALVCTVGRHRPGRPKFCRSPAPSISVESYLRRLQRCFLCADAAYVCALVLLDRFLMRSGDLPEGPHRLTAKNVHCLFFTCLVIAVKYNEDVTDGNTYFAMAGGMELRELNRLEAFVLLQIGFDIRVQPNEYRLYEGALRVLSAQPSEQNRGKSIRGFLCSLLRRLGRCADAGKEDPRWKPGTPPLAA